MLYYDASTARHRLNAHLRSIMASFCAPVEATARVEANCIGSVSTSRLSSFGFSGTIAHGAFGAVSTSLGGAKPGRVASYFRDVSTDCG